jgi:hypothetical protein
MKSSDHNGQELEQNEKRTLITKEEIINIAWSEAIADATFGDEDNVYVEDVLDQLDADNVRDLRDIMLQDLLRDQICVSARERGVPLREALAYFDVGNVRDLREIVLRDLIRIQICVSAREHGVPLREE